MTDPGPVRSRPHPAMPQAWWRKKKSRRWLWRPRTRAFDDARRSCSPAAAKWRETPNSWGGRHGGGEDSNGEWQEAESPFPMAESVGDGALLPPPLLRLLHLLRCPQLRLSDSLVGSIRSPPPSGTCTNSDLSLWFALWFLVFSFYFYSDAFFSKFLDFFFVFSRNWEFNLVLFVWISWFGDAQEVQAILTFLVLVSVKVRCYWALCYLLRKFAHWWTSDSEHAMRVAFSFVPS